MVPHHRGLWPCPGVCVAWLQCGIVYRQALCEYTQFVLEQGVLGPFVDGGCAEERVGVPGCLAGAAALLWQCGVHGRCSSSRCVNPVTSVLC